jgi:hypothetical protein
MRQAIDGLTNSSFLGLGVFAVVILVGAPLLVLLIVRLVSGLRTYFKQRGTRLVKCPENQQHAAVELDAKRAATSAFFGSPYFRLSDCSRWPERKGCGQECLRQIELAPEECLVKKIVSRWYEGKKCVYCGKVIQAVDWVGHKPALMNSEKKTIYWDSFPPEKLPDVFSSYDPVCWDCHITETFRREHPEMVVDRPWH